MIDPTLNSLRQASDRLHEEISQQRMIGTPRGTEAVEMVEVIRVREHKGIGVPSDPSREVISYWTKDGMLLVRQDPLDREENDEDEPLE